MTQAMTQAILVSHGQPSDTEAGEAEIAQLAQRVAAQKGMQAIGLPVAGVTLAAKGRLEALLSRHPTALVYPMFMSDGWFTRVQLRRRMGAAQGPGQDRAQVLAPFGTDPDLPWAAAQALQAECAARGWSSGETGLAILAHGSGRSPFAALDTVIFADRLRRHMPWADLRLGFVEQAPSLVTALSRMPHPALALPFFAARRGHVREDLPQAATQAGFVGHMLDPLGLFDMVPGMIARSLMRATSADTDQYDPSPTKDAG
ncbi:MAG: CbiX/SirB N-terminal domain-containing protein [Paracoccaceae bacterium]